MKQKNRTIIYGIRQGMLTNGHTERCSDKQLCYLIALSDHIEAMKKHHPEIIGNYVHIDWSKEIIYCFTKEDAKKQIISYKNFIEKSKLEAKRKGLKFKERY